MIDTLFKILGAAHGLFGLASLWVLRSEYKAGHFDNFSRTEASIKLASTSAGAGLLFMCMWSSWHLFPKAHIYAWLGLIALFIAALCGTGTVDGVNRHHRLTPVFYAAIFMRITAAFLLSVLAKNLATPAVGG